MASASAGLDRPQGDFLVDDLGALRQRDDVAHAFREGTDEGRARGGLGDGEECSGVLAADVVGQLRALGQDDGRGARLDVGDLQVEVADEGHGDAHPLGDRFIVHGAHIIRWARAADT
jgi:hypothetical protein